jgi:hypothetical protein
MRRGDTGAHQELAPLRTLSRVAVYHMVLAGAANIGSEVETAISEGWVSKAGPSGAPRLRPKTGLKGLDEALKLLMHPPPVQW